MLTSGYIPKKNGNERGFLDNCEIGKNLVPNLVPNQNPTLPEHKTGRWFGTRFGTKLNFAAFRNSLWRWVILSRIGNVCIRADVRGCPRTVGSSTPGDEHQFESYALNFYACVLPAEFEPAFGFDRQGFVVAGAGFAVAGG